MRREEISRLGSQLEKIESLTPVERQFIATILDTEAAIGYYHRKQFSKKRGFFVGDWRAYISMKMTHKGDIAHLAELMGLKTPSRTRLQFNTLKARKDEAWSIHTSGIRAYVAIRTVVASLYNEKTKTEAECIIRRGPYVPEDQPHPFQAWGGIRLRRGVWIWPRIDQA